MSNIAGPGRPGGVDRPDLGSADAAETEAVAASIDRAPGRSGALSWIDSDRSTARLAAALAGDGKIDAEDARALLRDAEDFGAVTKQEQGVFVSLLCKHGSRITPAALDVLARHFGVPLGRPSMAAPAPAPAPAGPTEVSNATLRIAGDQAGGIAGFAAPGATIEAINLSSAPEGRLHLTDTTVIATADASGKFAGRLPDMQEGDTIRLRARYPDGTTSEWLDITVSGTGRPDTRGASVNLERIDLVARDVRGEIAVKHNTDRPLTEPGARLRFTNVRTGETFDAVATSAGSLPPGLKLRGRAGDEFTVAASDGKNNVDFSTIAGKLRTPGDAGAVSSVEFPDPAPLDRDAGVGGPPMKTRFRGPLFVGEPSPEDIKQGAIGDCYFPAALGALAAKDPQAIKNAIKDNGDGTYSVRFYEGGNRRRPVDIQVDGALYTRSWGGPMYGQSLGTGTNPATMELWFPLIEKAYAQWKGGYQKIGEGDVAGRVLSEITGRPSTGRASRASARTPSSRRSSARPRRAAWSAPGPTGRTRRRATPTPASTPITPTPSSASKRRAARST